MLKERQKLLRQERKLLDRIKSRQIYKLFTSLIYKIFPLNKKYLIFRGKTYKKSLWIISITSFLFLWKKIWYIDDFIVNKKSRWKWIWKKIFTNALDKLKTEKNNYAFLISRNDRKVSHNVYKKFWFKIIGLSIGILAYKKFRKNKK